MRSVVVALVALLAAGVLAWCALREDRVAPVDRSNVEDAATQTATSSTGDATASLDTSQSASSPSSSPARIVDTAPGAPELPAHAHLVDILVVDAATGAPVADAEVVFDGALTSERIAALPHDERNRYLQDREAAARTFGATTRTDAEGVAHVYVAARHAVVHARHGARYGVLHLDATSQGPPHRHRLELRPDRSVTVQVLDASGQPAIGVPLRIRGSGEDSVRVSEAAASVSPVETTAPDGVTTFVHLQNAHALNLLPNARDATWQVFVAVPGLEHVAAAVDLHVPPATPIVLRLPPTGAIATRLVAAGRRVGGRDLKLTTEAALDGPNAWNLGWPRKADADGWTRFPHVPLGATFRVLAGHPVASRAFAGPVTAGEELRFEFAPGDGVLVLTGRLVDAASAPIRSSSAQVDFDLGIAQGTAVVVTDADGHFTWVVGAKPSGDVALKRLRFTLRSPNAPPTSHAVAPRSLSDAVTDLGDLMLRAPPVVVAGRFEFGDGVQPIPIAFDVERFVAVAGPGQRDRWWRINGIDTSQQRDGSFAVTGEVPARRFRLVFPAYHHLPIEPIEFRFGASDLVIPVDLGASLTAIVLLPAGLPRDARGLQGELRPVGNDPPARERLVVDVLRGQPERGELRWKAIPAGDYVLEIRTSGAANPIATVHDVAVPGPPDGDPRLTAIDLRDRVRVVTLRFGDAVSVVVFPMPQDPATEWGGIGFSGSELHLLVGADPTHLLVAAREWKPVELRDVRGEVDVVFERWPEVEIVFEGLDALPPHVGVTAQFAAQSGDAPRYRVWGHSNDRNELLSAPTIGRTAESGRVRLPIGNEPRVLRLWLTDEAGRAQPMRFSLPDVAPSASPVVVRIPPEVLQSALAALAPTPESGK